MQLSRAQIVTVAKFRKPRFPKTCNVKAYHVWVWNHPDDSSIDAESAIHIGPPVGQTCECGLLPWTAEDRQRGWHKAAEARP